MEAIFKTATLVLCIIKCFEVLSVQKMLSFAVNKLQEENLKPNIAM